MTKAGTILGEKYEILKEIGHGGMSVVYLAMDVRLNKQWAIKEMKSHPSMDKDFLWKSLQMEANVLKKVDHPVLPRIVDVIQWNERIYVVMDYIEGSTLDVVLKKEGPQSQEKVIQWGIDLCSALDYLHSLTPPIIYRDMKPSNIMLKPDGKVKLIDFGTAKELDESRMADTTALGTRGYAAPEQFGDAEGRGLYITDARTDIYSLGVTLYHMVTGKNPGEPPYVMQPIRIWDNTLSSGLEKIIYKCTRMNPFERYQDCKELLYDLEHYEKLDDEYRKECFRKMRSFLIVMLWMICSAVFSVLGYTGREREQHSTYEAYIKAGFEYTLRGEYEDAAEQYIRAITEVDGTRSTAYIELLTLYKNYMDESLGGLNQVTYYIQQQQGNIHKNQEVLFRVALDYFEVAKDYKTSAYYFGLIDPTEYPEATYYRSIALAMVEFDVDYEGLFVNMKQFEKLVDELPVSVRKLTNYKLLCVAYAQCLEQGLQALEGLQRVSEKGLKVLDLYEDDYAKAEYYTIYYQYLSIASKGLGDWWIAEEQELARSYYSRTIECCDFILSVVSKTSQKTVGTMTDNQLRQAKYCQKAAVYESLCDYEKACKVYELGEKEYARDGIDLYIGHMTLLCKIEEERIDNIEQWDKEEIKKLHEIASKVTDIEQDYRWKQLIQKLSPILGGREVYQYLM